jgi:hypothetical protein
MLAVRAATNATRRLLPVPTSVNPVASLRKRSQKLFRLQTRSGEFRTHPLAQMLKTLLLRQKDQAISQPQNRKGRAISQPEILAELFGNGKLPLLANLRRSQVFECGILAFHSW